MPAFGSEAVFACCWALHRAGANAVIASRARPTPARDGGDRLFLVHIASGESVIISAPITLRFYRFSSALRTQSGQASDIATRRNSWLPLLNYCSHFLSKTKCLWKNGRTST